MKEDDAYKVIAVILAVGMIAVAFFAVIQPANLIVSDQQRRTISVTGTSSVSADPDEVIMLLGAETQAENANASQSQNAQAMGAIETALLGAGVAEKDIKTVSYSIYPVYNYSERGTSSVVGYKTTHIFQVKTNSMGIAGKILDSAVAAGANRVDSISFGLRDETASLIRRQIMQAADADAMLRANNIALGLNVTIARVLSASEGYVSVSNYIMPTAEMKSGGATTVQPGQVEVQASVSVVYELA